MATVPAPHPSSVTHARVADAATSGTVLAPGVPSARVAAPSLFDQVPGVYAFWREHLFRDDTDRILAALWPDGHPQPGTRLLELGCGPGFYARRIAARFPEIRATGVDRSVAQLAGARTRLDATPLPNCHFDLGDVTRLPYPAASVDAVISSRLLSSVDTPLRVIAEAHRVLRPGGRCFIAEPRSSVRAAVPIGLMRMAAAIDAVRHRRPVSLTGRVSVLEPGAFRAVIRSRPWGSVTEWEEGAYRYAVLEKAGGPPTRGESIAQLEPGR